MKRILLTLYIFIALSSLANADFIQCRDKNGKTIFINYAPPPELICEGATGYTQNSPAAVTTPPANKQKNEKNSPIVQAGSNKKQIIYTDDFKNDVMTLLKITGSENLVIQMSTAVTNQIIDSLSKGNAEIPQRALAAIKDEIHKTIKEATPRLVAEYVPLYAMHFSQSEIKSLIAFYKTPLGKKSIKTMPAIMNDSFQLGQAWGQSLTSELKPRIAARLKREGFSDL